MHLLAREICDPAAAWARLSGGLPHGRETDRALDRGEGPAPGRAVFGSRPQIARIDPGGFCPPAFAVLVESFGRGPARDSVDRCGIVRRRSLRLVQCPRACSAVAALHVVRPCRAESVWLRVGSAVAGDGIPRDFSLPAPGWPAVCAACAASRRPMAVPMADLPNHAGSRAHQDPGRFVLAGCDSPLLPL